MPRHLPVLALSCLLAACQGAPPVAPASPKPSEQTISGSSFANVSIAADGRSFTLVAADGKPLGELAVIAAGKPYTTRAGALALPASALREAKERSKGFFRVFAPGYAPRQVWIGQPETTIRLQPLAVKATPVPIPPKGGKIGAPEAGITVDVPAGALAGASATRASLGTYAAEVTAEDKAGFAKDRSAFMARLKGRAPFAVLADEPCADDERPLPCRLLDPDALGLYLTVGGPLAASTLTFSLDLARLEASCASCPDATVARRLRRTLDQIAAEPGGMAALKDGWGVVRRGDVIDFPVRMPDARADEGYLQTTVESLLVLGAKVEVTVVNLRDANVPAEYWPPGLADAAAAGRQATLVASLAELLDDPAGAVVAPRDGRDAIDWGGGFPGDPPGTATTGTAGERLLATLTRLLGNNGASILVATREGGPASWRQGGSLLSDAGGSLISDAGGGLISDKGGSLISDHGGGLIGKVKLVQAGSDLDPGMVVPKFRIQAVGERPWAGVPVTFKSFGGVVATTTTDAQGHYVFPPVAERQYGWLEASAGGNLLYGLAAREPGVVNVSPVNVAVSLVGARIRRALGLGYEPAGVDLGGARSDARRLDPLIDAAQAAAVPTMTEAERAAAADALYRRAGLAPEATRPRVSLAMGSVGGSFTTGITQQGATAVLPEPRGVGVMPTGEMTFVLTGAHFFHKITFIPVPGAPVEGGLGPGAYAEGTANAPGNDLFHLDRPEGIAFYGDRAAMKSLVADAGNHRIWRHELAGGTRESLNVGTPGHLDGDPGTAQLDSPYQVVAAEPYVFVAERQPGPGTTRLRYFHLGDRVWRTITLPAQVGRPCLAVDGQTLYVTGDLAAPHMLYRYDLPAEPLGHAAADFAPVQAVPFPAASNVTVRTGGGTVFYADAARKQVGEINLAEGRGRILAGAGGAVAITGYGPDTAPFVEIGGMQYAGELWDSNTGTVSAEGGFLVVTDAGGHRIYVIQL